MTEGVNSLIFHFNSERFLKSHKRLFRKDEQKRKAVLTFLLCSQFVLIFRPALPGLHALFTAAWRKIQKLALRTPGIWPL